VETPPPPASPSPWAALRRTRRALIAVAILLGLWLLLVLGYMGIVAPGIDFHCKLGRLDRSIFFFFGGFVVSHAIVWWKLIRLIKAAGKPEMESDPKDAARAFSAFWKTNLRAHAILPVLMILLILLALFT
jgi:hypothetical protein